MSEDIDFSNQRVQETIDFLSQQTCPQLPNIKANKDETRRNDKEISEKFAENLAHETLEDVKLIVAVSQKNDITVKIPEASEVIDNGNENQESNKASIMQWLTLSKHPDAWNEDNQQNADPETTKEHLNDSLTSNEISAEFLSKTNDVLKALDDPETALPKEEADLLKSLLSFEMNDLMSMKNYGEAELSTANNGEINTLTCEEKDDVGQDKDDENIKDECTESKEISEISSNQCHQNVEEVPQEDNSFMKDSTEENDMSEICNEEVGEQSNDQEGEGFNQNELCAKQSEDNITDKNVVKDLENGLNKNNVLNDQEGNGLKQNEFCATELKDDNTDKNVEKDLERNELNENEICSEEVVDEKIDKTNVLNDQEENGLDKNEILANELEDENTDKNILTDQEGDGLSKREDRQDLHSDKMFDVVLDNSQSQDPNTQVIEWLNHSTTQGENDELMNKERIVKENEKLKKLERTFSYEIDRCRDNVKDIQETFLGNHKHLEDTSDERPGVLSDDDMPGLLDTTCENENISEAATIEVENMINECKKMERSSESRMSMKKRKNKNSLRNNPGAENGCILSEENKRKSKSIEMFDYYVNSIDELKPHEGEQHKEDEKIKIITQEKEIIESLLNTIPADMTNNGNDDQSQVYSEDPDSKGDKKANL